MCSGAAPAWSAAVATSGAGGGRVRPDPPRRSKSQGTRKLHKCLSTASYSEDFGGGSGQFSCTGGSPMMTTGQRQQLLVARQYCSFGSTVTGLEILFFLHILYTSSPHYFTYVRYDCSPSFPLVSLTLTRYFRFLCVDVILFESVLLHRRSS